MSDLSKLWRQTRLAVAALSVFLLGSCASGVDYSNTATLPPLDVPPDLSNLPPAEDIGTLGDNNAAATFGPRGAEPMVGGTETLLPDFDIVRMERAGGQRWLVVHADPEKLWYEMRAFLLKNGFLIAKQDPRTGIMETAWRESHPLVAGKTKNALSKVLGSLYSTGLRDKFRLRLERGKEPGTTELYISHRGMEEVVAAGGGTDVVQTVWQPRDSDPGLEVELMRLFMSYLGGDAKKIERVVKAEPARAETPPAAAPQRAVLANDAAGNSVLRIRDEFDTGWRRLGLALDRIGFTVEDRDRSNGVYYVRYLDPGKEDDKPGFFARLFGAKAPENSGRYQIKALGEGHTTEVRVLNNVGAPESSKTGKRILVLLQEQLN